MFADAKKKKKADPAAVPAAKPGVEHHAFDLEKPSDWAALVGLVQTARSGNVVWRNLTLAGKKKVGPLPPETWPADMPMSGKVEFDVKPAASKPGMRSRCVIRDWSPMHVLSTVNATYTRWTINMCMPALHG